MASLVKRGPAFYLQHYVAGKPKRINLKTDSLQVAKEKLRQFESAQARGIDNILPTRTPIADVVTNYVNHIRSRKTAKSAQTDVYYLRDAFGPVCPTIAVNSRKRSPNARKRPILPALKPDGRRRAPVIEADCFEQVTTAQVSAFITGQVQSRGLAPKTANRYREILCRLFNWAMKEQGLRLPGDRNPVAPVGRYREHAPQIRFLTLPQVDEQLRALESRPQLRAMVAALIYAGLRREELLWLTLDDVDLRRTQQTPHGILRIRSKTVSGDFWEPKTKVNRAIPISSSLRAILDAYAPRPSTGAWYFPSPDLTRWDPDNFSSDLRTANTAASLQWGCLDYRHTFGSQLAQANVSLFKIATLMGNSPEICRRHYAALIPEGLAVEVEFSKPVATTSRSITVNPA